MELRPYQQEAKSAVYKFFKENPGKNPCVVLPTGAGKTPVLASMCMDIVTKRKGRVLVVTHVKELLEQAKNTLSRVCPNIKVGLYSAGLNVKETQGDVIVAGVQSIYKNAFILGKFDVIIVDEAHLIPPEGDGMYQQLLKDMKLSNPHIRLVGLTATPYRMKSGHLCSENGFLNDICYEANVRDLIDQGYLSKVQTRVVENGVDTSDLHIARGEFVSSEVDALMNNALTVYNACKEIVEKRNAYNRKKVLLFASNVKHAECIKTAIESLTSQPCGIVLGSTDSKERAETLRKFKEGELIYLVNVGVLTTGFDDPTVDLVAILRPTASPGLYYQMVGRGLRKSEGKEYCLVLDFGENINRHGPIDEIKVKEKRSSKSGGPLVKACPKCQTYAHISAKICSVCHYEFPIQEQEDKLKSQSSGKDIISRKYNDSTHEVDSVKYNPHISKKGNKSLRVTYVCKDNKEFTEWINIEVYDGYARVKARKWWSSRCMYPLPDNVDDAMELVKSGLLAIPKEITVRKYEGDKYSSIINAEIEEIPNFKNETDEDKLPVIKGTCRECEFCLIWGKQTTCMVDDYNHKSINANDPICSKFMSEKEFYDDVPF